MQSYYSTSRFIRQSHEVMLNTALIALFGLCHSLSGKGGEGREGIHFHKIYKLYYKSPSFTRFFSPLLPYGWPKFQEGKHASLPQVNTTRYGLRSFRVWGRLAMEQLPEREKSGESFSLSGWCCIHGMALAVSVLSVQHELWFLASSFLCCICCVLFF